MPPKTVAASRKRENMYFEPGVRGRKTGLTVPDTGIRDEMGMEPIDDLFSSPEKTVVLAPIPQAPAFAPVQSARKVAQARPAPPAQVQAVPQLAAPKIQPLRNGTREIATTDETNSYEESMQIGNSTMPEPTAVLTERRKSMHVPLPKSKSPTKTFLGSPARRHPSIQPVSSPTRGTVMRGEEKGEKEPVARKLNFSNGDHVFTPPRHDLPSPKTAIPKSPAPAPAMRAPVMKTPAPATNEKRKRAGLEKENRTLNDVAAEDIPAPDSVRSVAGVWEEPTPFPSQKRLDRSLNLSPNSIGDDDYQPQISDDAMEDNFEQLLERTATPPEPSPPRAVVPKKRGRPSLENENENEKDKGKGKEIALPEKKKPGRPKSKEKEKGAIIPMAQAEQYLEIEASRIYSEDEAPALPPAKKSKASKLSSKDVNRKISIKRAAELAKDVESSPVQIQRGPPRPRQNGLFILRRETPALNGFTNTRTGRTNVKPAAYWKNEVVVYGGSKDAGDQNFLIPAVKEDIRRDEVELDDEVRDKRRSKKSRRQEIEEEESEEQDLAEPWESAPGRVFGAVKEWSSSKGSAETTASEREDEIAFSGPAIITRPIPGSEVQFAKTLTLPFFGSGMVDLPPGAIKKPKNSRKMQMVFFVHKGNVKVTVNGTEFRISAGGMWQVPRGNFYSIENCSGREARIFFSQGCEVPKDNE